MAQRICPVYGEVPDHKARDSKNLTVPEIQAESDALFKSIGDGAITTDEAGRITRINPTALNILGLKTEDAIGHWFHHIVTAVHPDNTPVSLADRPIVKMFVSGRPTSEKLLYRTTSNRLVPVSVTVSPIILGGKPVGAIEVFRDITLDNEIDRMKSEFISLASHQLRTPLASVKTYAHMLMDGYMGKLKPKQAAAVRTIIIATNKMNELISVLLNIARMESGHIAVNIKRLNAVSMAEDVVKQLKIAADIKTISLVLDIPEKPAMLTTDSLIAREILTNLVSNSIKYTPPHGTITLTVRKQEDDILFTVSDTGIGIPKQSQDQIFAKFFRAQNVVYQEPSGTGLGLYVAKGLVTTLHGKIWFKSEEDRGSTFYVSLPIDNSETVGSQQQPAGQPRV